MLQCSAASRSCIKHILNNNRIIFKTASLNIPTKSVRLLSISSLRSSSDEKLSNSDVAALFESKSSSQTVNSSIIDPVTSSEASPDIFSEGAESLLSSVPVDVTNSLAEPTFKSLGLAHGYPSGWLQSYLEILHIDVGLPWWQAIAVTTLCLRIIIFPVMISSQKSIVMQNEHAPTIQKLQVQAQRASMSGNADEVKFANQALNNYMMAENCHPYKIMLPLITQAMFFSTVFFGLRAMCNVPVESLKTGGLYWFTDLTAADPTMMLPLLTASTLLLQIHLGADGMNTANAPPMMKYFMYSMPIISIPVMINFPVALNLYWLTSNMISLVQATTLRQPAVREKLGIREMTKWKPEDLPMTNFYVSR